MTDRLKRIRNILVVGGLTMGSRVLGMVRDMIQAYVLPSAFFDAFDVAFTFPNLFRRLFGEGALSAAFIPVLKEEMEKGDDASTRRLINGTATLLFLILAGLIVVSYIVAGGLQHFVPKYKESGELFRMLYIMLPYILFICMTALIAGALNSLGSFGVPAAGPIVLNVCMISALVLLVRPTGDPKWLAVAVVAAGVVTLAMQVIALHLKGIPLRPCLDFRQAQIGKMIGLIAPVILGLGVMQINVMFDRIIAYAMVPGNGANKVLYIGNRLMQLPLGVFGIAIATVVFPELAACAARKDDKGFLDTLRHGLRLVLFICIPAAVGLIVLGRPIIELLFERGKFVAADTTRTAWVLGMYSLGLWSFSSYHVVTRAFYSQQDTKTPVKVSACMVVANLILNLILVQTRLHESGLALATSVCSIANLLILTAVLHKRLGRIGARAVLASVARVAIATVLMGAVCVAVLRVLPESTGLTVRLIRVFAPMAAGGATFLIASLLLRIEELRDLTSALLKRRGK
ncbi:MAG: murein biosynthesis integral membrane protein MurJ [Planctomycetes bacterium]|nr:murein biosynthesis integral membrane protein MurJ [Planctomycetota bacterium]